MTITIYLTDKDKHPAYEDVNITSDQQRYHFKEEVMQLWNIASKIYYNEELIKC